MNERHRRIAFALTLGGALAGCFEETSEQEEPLIAEGLGEAKSAMLAGTPFPLRREGTPSGTYFSVGNNHHDITLARWDGANQRWTSSKPGVTTPTSLDDYLIYGEPVYASKSGEVVTCWRNAPENPVDRPHPGRDGCNDKDEDGNPCDQNSTCSCTVPRSGNHVNIVSTDGTIMLYAHMIPGSVPSAICPHEAEYVADANEKEPWLGGTAKGHNPDMYVPPSSRVFVQRGQFLGFVGHSGASGQPHLHHHQKTYANRAKIHTEYTGGDFQPRPNGPAISSAWQPLDGNTTLKEGDTDPKVIVRASYGPGEDFAYAKVADPDASHTANARYARSSTGDFWGEGVSVPVTHLGTGQYRVTFSNASGNWSGNVQVSAFGNGARRCKLVSQSELWTDVSIRVNCYTTSGTLADGRFMVSYVRKTSPTGEPAEAYLTSNGQTSDTIDIELQYNSTGNPNRVVRTGRGRYVAYFPGQSPAPRGGTVQVTAIGATANHCKVEQWSASPFWVGDVEATVRCFNTVGELADTPFSLYYATELASGARSGGHAWANSSTSSSYAPQSTYEATFLSGAGELSSPTHAYRSQTGRYQVRFPALGEDGATAMVSAYGTSSDYCKISNTAASGNAVLVSVRCFDVDGNPADERFTLSYGNMEIAPAP